MSGKTALNAVATGLALAAAPATAGTGEASLTTVDDIVTISLDGADSRLETHGLAPLFLDATDDWTVDIDYAQTCCGSAVADDVRTPNRDQKSPAKPAKQQPQQPLPQGNIKKTRKKK